MNRIRNAGGYVEYGRVNGVCYLYTVGSTEAHALLTFREFGVVEGDR